ncbi:MAG: hypothetical protein QMD36_00385 [Candidatus Aenigmarchaeota archaeon]|nr:hypothetical protein [Candidatus Aenigmarchaeota archaeon]
MPFDWNLVSISLTVVFIATFVLFYIFDNLAKIWSLCEKNKSFKVCTLGSLPVIVLMLLLIAGGLIMVINITAYIMISGSTRV